MTTPSPRHFPLLCLARRLKYGGPPIPGTHPHDPVADKGRIMTWADVAEWDGTDRRDFRLVTAAVSGLYDRLMAYAGIAALLVFMPILVVTVIAPSIWPTLSISGVYAAILVASRVEHHRWLRHFIGAATKREIRTGAGPGWRPPAAGSD